MIVNWDNGRKAVIITDIPRELLDESEVVKKYFDRWPLQEKIFREEKSGVHIQYVVGHGTKMDSYDKMAQFQNPVIFTFFQEIRSKTVRQSGNKPTNFLIYNE